MNDSESDTRNSSQLEDSREDTGKALPQGPWSVPRYVDQILRHRDESFTHVFENKDTIRRIFALSSIILALSAFHGLGMGWTGGPLQMVSSAIKVPMLYLVTLGVCFPLLYVVNVILGSRLGFLQTCALILLAMTLSSILLAACSPVVMFFAMSGSDYHFVKLIHVGVFAFSGLLGMAGLRRGLHVMCRKSNLYPEQAVRILQVWIVVFAFVGCQMAWSLRPFIGAPGMEFQIFRAQESNFYHGVWSSVVGLYETRGSRPESTIEFFGLSG